MKLNSYLSQNLGQECMGRQKKEILPIVLAAAALASTAAGTAASASANNRARREQRNALDRERAENDAWYNKNRYQSYAETAAGQNLIRKATDYAKYNAKSAAGRARVGGATEASAALAKEQGNKVVQETLADVASTDTARQDRAEYQHHKDQQAYQRGISAVESAYGQAQAQNVANAAQQASNAAMLGAMYIGGNAPSTSLKGGNNGGTPASTPDIRPMDKVTIGGMEEDADVAKRLIAGY